ncbi:hypothetical protein BKA69DRAFT_1037401 [Paraphysoderma sedebokerense]|nr:hypothetical protein BKA69DRAFT_1037401 [Paraphysoderma sedebokerense]
MSAGEIAFISQYLDIIADKPIAFKHDFVPYKNTLHPSNVKPPLASSESLSAPSSFSITFKLLKSTSTHSLTVNGTDLITSIKSKLSPVFNATPDSIKLLVKGKVLSDDKRVKDIKTLEPNVVVTVMIKPGSTPDVSAAATAGTDKGKVKEVSELESAKEDESFWSSLRKVIENRLKDKSQVDLVLKEFRKAYEQVVAEHSQ